MSRAHLVCRGGRWRLFVLLPGESEWPTHYFPGALAPTVEQRSRVLAALGYTPTDGSEWSWTEDSERFEDPASPVLLIACMPVVPSVGGAS
ncbi:DUF6303 family protein [Streptomyces sp. NPDC048603]|uniref:DUF6303 family protein n=1 Tax=Streptomyces sp. NPDC048603 TaxID=3365577 RepID=UPI003718CD4D